MSNNQEQKKPSTSAWMRLVSYNTPETVEAILQSRPDVQGYALAFHDQFTDWERENEQCFPHTHVVLHLNNSRTFDTVRGWFKTLDGNTLTTSCEFPAQAVQYLTHDTKDSAQKFHFDPSIVVYSEGFKAEVEAKMMGGARHPDRTAEIFDKFMDNANLTDLVHEHGKDFLYHYNAFKAVKHDIIGARLEDSSSRAFEENRVLRSIINVLASEDPDVLMWALSVVSDSASTTTASYIIDEIAQKCGFERTHKKHPYKEN